VEVFVFRKTATSHVIERMRNFSNKMKRGLMKKKLSCVLILLLLLFPALLPGAEKKCV
jgi:hypothetical protein